jgi:hypothetical protein
VELIRIARVDAKLDANRNQLVTGGAVPPMHKLILDATSELNSITEMRARELARGGVAPGEPREARASGNE